MSGIQILINELLKFRYARQREQFHNTKDLALAISIEAYFFHASNISNFDFHFSQSGISFCLKLKKLMGMIMMNQMTKFMDAYVIKTGLGRFYRFRIKDNLSGFGAAPVMKSCKTQLLY